MMSLFSLLIFAIYSNNKNNITLLSLSFSQKHPVKDVFSYARVCVCDSNLAKQRECVFLNNQAQNLIKILDEKKSRNTKIRESTTKKRYKNFPFLGNGLPDKKTHRRNHHHHREKGTTSETGDDDDEDKEERFFYARNGGWVDVLSSSSSFRVSGVFFFFFLQRALRVLSLIFLAPLTRVGGVEEERLSTLHALRGELHFRDVTSGRLDSFRAFRGVCFLIISCWWKTSRSS